MDLDAVASRIVRAIANGSPASPDDARFLLREYLASGRDDVRDALGLALAHALTAAASTADASDRLSIAERSAWLIVLVEAAGIADDDRVVAAAGDLVRRLRAAWPIDLADAGVAAAAASVDACLRASRLPDAPAIVQPAIDELERIVASAYRPGTRLSAAPPLASALLTAFELTGRLPYSMLAEELMQASREIATGCDAAIVFCRLAALHDNADYRAAAVLTPDADYRADAARRLRDSAPRALAARTADAALYGIALRELMSLR